MERGRCKLCFRNFANGRALGGHMRSHMMNFYAAKNSSKKEEEVEEEEQVSSYEKFQEIDDIQSAHAYSLSSSSSEDDDDDDDEKNGRKSPILVDQEFSVVLQDGESEAESSRNNPFCRRSKRVRKSRVFYSDRFLDEFSQAKKSRFGEANDQSPMSSISDTTPEEDVAHSLMMLSRDKWERETWERETKDSGVAKVGKTGVRGGKYRCETCSKLFRSYQALGGHRASHKKMIRVDEAAAGGDGGGPVAVAVEERIHECPFCDRVFASGQALGGHKRSHFIGAAANVSSNIRPVKQFSRTGGNLDIDLNLPAPIDDDDHDDIRH